MRAGRTGITSIHRKWLCKITEWENGEALENRMWRDQRLSSNVRHEESQKWKYNAYKHVWKKKTIWIAMKIRTAVSPYGQVLMLDVTNTCMGVLNSCGNNRTNQKEEMRCGRNWVEEEKTRTKWRGRMERMIKIHNCGMKPQSDNQNRGGKVKAR